MKVRKKRKTPHKEMLMTRQLLSENYTQCALVQKSTLSSYAPVSPAIKQPKRPKKDERKITKEQMKISEQRRPQRKSKIANTRISLAAAFGHIT